MARIAFASRGQKGARMMATHDESDGRGGAPAPRGPESAGGPGATAAQLKQDIDSGATAEKVAVFDPGAANLGTDTEAAGMPASPGIVKLDRDRQRVPDPPPGHPGMRMAQGKGLMVGAVLAALVALGLLAVAMG